MKNNSQICWSCAIEQNWCDYSLNMWVSYYKSQSNTFDLKHPKQESKSHVSHNAHIIIFSMLKLIFLDNFGKKLSSEEICRQKNNCRQRNNCRPRNSYKWKINISLILAPNYCALPLYEKWNIVFERALKHLLLTSKISPWSFPCSQI